MRVIARCQAADLLVNHRVLPFFRRTSCCTSPRPTRRDPRNAEWGTYQKRVTLKRPQTTLRRCPEKGWPRRITCRRCTPGAEPGVLVAKGLNKHPHRSDQAGRDARVDYRLVRYTCFLSKIGKRATQLAALCRARRKRVPVLGGDDAMHHRRCRSR